MNTICISSALFAFLVVLSALVPMYLICFVWTNAYDYCLRKYNRWSTRKAVEEFRKEILPTLLERQRARKERAAREGRSYEEIYEEEKRSGIKPM